MRQSIIGSAGLVAALAFASPSVLADKCTALVGKTQCFAFVYSNGGSNFYRATFSAGNVFSFPDVSGTTGTWTCPGLNFIETNYLFGGFEQQQWLARAQGVAGLVQGNGKSISNGYLYSVKKTNDANCAAAAPETMRVPGASQAE